MLKQLLITNIVLIESTAISFEKGLNVISGETGSGKSAIMNALSLVLGSKTDPKVIRRGSLKGAVEAIFDIDENLSVQKLLNEAGFEHQPQEGLIIRREMTPNGKSRCFINNQAAQSTFLKKLSDFLVNIVTQHASQWLLIPEKHRDIVDVYGDLENIVQEFGMSFTKELEMSKKLEQLIQNEQNRFRQIHICQMEIEELQEADLKEGEEEEIFAEYTLLMNAEARASKVNEIINTLSNDRSSAMTLLNRQNINFQELAKIDQTLLESSTAFKNAILEIQEIIYTLKQYNSHIENHPLRAQELNERLTLIVKLKKKYGESVAEIKEYENNAIKKLEELENQDFLIEALKEELTALKILNDQLEQNLKLKRKAAAKAFEEAIQLQLNTLNMPKVIFEVEFKDQKRSAKGNDHLEFYFIPNVGEHKTPIKDSASGGELARLLLAIETLLAGKKSISTLVFDEIDANIGGETAFIIGEKLKEIGKKQQVLCITHFPQVAKQADHHIQISKIEENGRTLTEIHILKEEAKFLELSRMLGEKKINNHSLQSHV